MLNDYWNDEYAIEVWQAMVELLDGNEIGAAAWLGNMCWESGVCPYRVQGKNYEQSYTYTTGTVRNQSRSEFVGDSTGGGGYSLMQWTYSTRKGWYYDYCGQSLLGDSDNSKGYLIYEMETYYSTVLDHLKNATDINSETEYLMRSSYIGSETTHLANRQQMARNAYEDFSGTPPPPPLGIPYWLLFKFKHLL